MGSFHLFIILKNLTAGLHTLSSVKWFNHAPCRLNEFFVQRNTGFLLSVLLMIVYLPRSVILLLKRQGCCCWCFTDALAYRTFNGNGPAPLVGILLNLILAEYISEALPFCCGAIHCLRSVDSPTFCQLCFFF